MYESYLNRDDTINEITSIIKNIFKHHNIDLLTIEKKNELQNVNMLDIHSVDYLGQLVYEYIFKEGKIIDITLPENKNTLVLFVQTTLELIFVKNRNMGAINPNSLFYDINRYKKFENLTMEESLKLLSEFEIDNPANLIPEYI